MLENLHQAHHHVQRNLSHSHEKNKMYYDRKAKPVKFKVGDMVISEIRQECHSHLNYHRIGNHFIV